MDSSFWFDTINLALYIYTGYNFQIKNVFLSWKLVFGLASSVDLDEMSHYAAFHLGLHGLPKYTFRSH